MKLASLESIARTLNEAQVRYLIVGGLAVAAHGYGRATFDVDLVIQLEFDNVMRTMDALESVGYRPVNPVRSRDFADAAVRETWIRDKQMVVFQLRSDRHRETSIDIFVSEPFDFNVEYERALIGELVSQVPVRFVCLETLLQMKETAGRAKDQEDIRQLRLLSGNLNDDR
jgi:predicted nucleotidyltransferase